MKEKSPQHNFHSIQKLQELRNWKRETINMNRRKRVEYHNIDMVLKLVLRFIHINVYMNSIFYLKYVYLP